MYMNPLLFRRHSANFEDDMAGRLADFEEKLLNFKKKIQEETERILASDDPRLSCPIDEAPDKEEPEDPETKEAPKEEAKDDTVAERGNRKPPPRRTTFRSKAQGR